MMRVATAFLASAVLLVGCGSRSDAEPAPAPRAGQVPATKQAPITGVQAPSPKPFIATPVASFTAPWAMTFLPDGRMLVTEKAGQLVLLSADGRTKRVVATIPQVDSAGQGGLMDVVLHPGFARNGLVYFSYSSAGQGGKGVVLARGRLDLQPGGERLREIEAIFRASPLVEGNGHYSGRIAFAPDGKLFFTNGERQKFDPAQDKQATLGKVLRLNDDGTPAAGNPLAAEGFHPAVWSYGHRNLLGLAFDAQGNF